MKDLTATLISRRRLADAIYEMRLGLQGETRPRPGQFAHIEAKGCFLRRPLSVAGYSPGELRVIVRAAGAGTRALTEMSAGESTKVLFPLGNPFPSEYEPGEIWLVGGGIGVAPLLYLGAVLAGEGRIVRSFIGFSREGEVFGVDELSSYGRVDLDVGGYITDVLLRALETAAQPTVCACGPSLMLAGVGEICRERGITAYASLEEHMGCGLGACLVCACKTRVPEGSAYRRVCADGPVFDLAEVMFE